MLYIIGIGLGDEKDITVKGLEAVKNSDAVYLESYTSKLGIDTARLEEFYGKKIIVADRNLVESNAENTILKDAKEGNAAFLVVGDALSATTHTDLWMRAKELGVETEIIHNASIITAIGVTGLQLYKFGRITTIPFANESVESPYNVLRDNRKMNLHTLMLLDIDAENNRNMSVNEAISYLLKTESKKKESVFDGDALCIGCAGLGSQNAKIKYGKASEISKIEFGKSMQCLIIPAEMHFMEEEILKNYL